MEQNIHLWVLYVKESGPRTYKKHQEDMPERFFLKVWMDGRQALEKEIDNLQTERQKREGEKLYPPGKVMIHLYMSTT